MEIQHLKYFVDVIEYGSFAKAAENLYVTRQTISSAVHQLENELGFALMLRNKNGVELTREGTLFYDRIREQFQQFDALEKDMMAYSTQRQVLLRIGISQYFEGKDAEPFQNWAKEHPEYRIEIILCNVIEGIQKIEQGEMDLLISMINPEASSSYVSEVIVEKQVVVYVHEDNPLSAKNTIHVEDLKNQVLLASNFGLEECHFLDQGNMPNFNDITREVNANAFFNLSLLLANKGVSIGYKDSMVLNSFRSVKGIPFQEECVCPYYLLTSM